MPPLGQLLDLLRGRRTRRTAEPSAAARFLESSRFVTALLLLLIISAIVLISFVGINPANVPVLPNQLATVRINAAVPFDFVSETQTQQARQHLLDRVPPVYRLDDTPLQQFEKATRELTESLAQMNHAGLKLPAARDRLIQALETFNTTGPYHVSLEDLSLLYAKVPADQRGAMFETGLDVLRSLYAEGVHEEPLAQTAPGNLTVLQIAHSDGRITGRPVQSLGDAMNSLRTNLTGGDLPADVSRALFHFFRNGLTPNLVFDRAATDLRKTEALARLKPVVVHVSAGQPIIEPGTPVTAEQYEMLVAHRQALRANPATRLDNDLQLFGRILLVLAMVLASAFYVRLEDRETFQSNGRLALLASVVILNIALIRGVYALGSWQFFAAHGGWASILPYVAPSALAPLIVAILIDAGSAIFMALFISIFTGVIYGNRLDLLVLTFLASVVAIFSCQHVRKRGRVVHAAGLGGLTIAIFALLIGIADRLPFSVLLRQFGAGLFSGVITGIIVVGLLPVLEGLFKRTTDITLLELTDYNHPLLRRMQLEAPGTYHHSLVVAQLAENACAEIGANPLLARVCALFHDIGKILKPEYFIENQRDRANPHDENNPSLSALIIKAHVKDGVDLARRHHLPRAIVDVIRQHHGTSLIRFFYYRARTRSANSAPCRGEHHEPAAPGLGPAEVAESTYRYDGPIPQFRESAVISLADGLEAASRSLRKVTPQNLDDLIATIVSERIADHQLDDAAITFSDLARIKRSFAFTLLNMLHARIDYPAGDPAPAAPSGSATA